MREDQPPAPPGPGPDRLQWMRYLGIALIALGIGGCVTYPVYVVSFTRDQLGVTTPANALLVLSSVIGFVVLFTRGYIANPDSPGWKEVRDIFSNMRDSFKNTPIILSISLAVVVSAWIGSIILYGLYNTLIGIIALNGVTIALNFMPTPYVGDADKVIKARVQEGNFTSMLALVVFAVSFPFTVITLFMICFV